MAASGKKVSLFKKLAPLAFILLAVFGLLSRDVPIMLRYGAMGIGLLLTIAWFFSETSWAGKIIKFRLFRSKLTKDQAVRLNVLLNDIDNYMSISYTYSPIYI